MTTMRGDERLHDGVHYPTGHMVAVLKDAQEAEQVAQTLRDAGFVDVEVLPGQQALRAIEATEQKENTLRRSWERLSRALSDEGDDRREYLAALQRGHALVLVYTPQRVQADQAESILRAHQAYAIRLFGRWTITDLRR